MKKKSWTKIKVFLVDDHPAVREGVRFYLTSHSIAVVGEASDAPEALRKVKKLSPEVIVLDVNLPSMAGWELAAAAGICPTTYSKIENGARDATLDQRLRLARALGVEPETIFSRVTV